MNNIVSGTKYRVSPAGVSLMDETNNLASHLARISYQGARWSRRDLDSQRILRRSGITLCISDWVKCVVDSKIKWGLVHLVRNAG